MINTITVPFSGLKGIPDPTKIITTWEWYFLDQISSSLIKWNSEVNAFEGVLAESWTQNEEVISFKLRKNLKFSNGEAITAVDVAASVKRSLLKRSSSHFRPWELLKGCENLQNIRQDCSGIEVVSADEVRFHLNYPSESFFLFMACPEGSVWWHADLEQELFSPSAFSGPYQVDRKTADTMALSSNELWALSTRFPHRPLEIIAFLGGESALRSKIINGDLDIFLDLERPFAPMQIPNNFEKRGTAFNTLYYLFGVSGRSKVLSRNCLINLWNKSFPEFISPAYSYLPFDGLSGIGKNEIITLLPETACGPVRIGYLKGYFSDEFLKFLFGGAPHELVPLSGEEYGATFSKEYRKGNLDFVLTPYVASERYPSVQISFLMEDREIPFDLSILDHTELSEKKIKTIHDVQAWTIKTQQIIPLVFGRSQLIFKRDLIVGNQPLVDSEIQLWRINEF